MKKFKINKNKKNIKFIYDEKEILENQKIF